MGRYVNPFTAQGFKIVFGQEVHKDLLIDFLNELLKGERQVEDISYVNTEIRPETYRGRVVIFDILCKETDGSFFLLEMQNQYQDFFLDRGLYYLCRIINNQGKKGKDWNYDLRPVYGIYFVNFSLPGMHEFRTDIQLTDLKTGRPVSTKLRQIYLSMSLFTKGHDECENDFERWLYLLKNMDILERMPFKAQKAIFEKLLDVAEVANLDESQRQEYDATLKAYRDYINTVRTSDRIAREQGVKEGLTRGRAEGRVETNQENALRMKQKGYPLEDIADITGLSVDEIAGL